MTIIDTSIQCPVCTSRKRAGEFSVTREDKYLQVDKSSGKPAAYWICSNCEAMVFDGTNEFEESYCDGSYYSVDGDPSTFLRKRFDQVVNLPTESSDNVQRVKRIREFLSKHWLPATSPSCVLDVGAGMGVFLHAFLNEQWQGSAIEPDPHACRHLRVVLPQIDISQGASSKVSLPHPFDLITLNRVLEHVAAPYEMLSAEAARLHGDGYLYIEVPDTLSYYLGGPNNEAFGHGHFVVYSPLALCIVAKGAGLVPISIERVKEPSTKFTLYGFFRKLSSIKGE